jgi:hypothetical protein
LQNLVRTRLWGTLLWLGVGPAALAGAGSGWKAQVFRSGSTQTALIELFTSEGCSSCPPAEEWLSSLVASDRLWKDFVPVAFHVDYWDDLGWRDPFGAATFSHRQRGYASEWRRNNIYTPAFVLNGEEWTAWFGRRAPGASETGVGVLEARQLGSDRFEARFEPEPRESSSYQLHAALLGCGIESEVRAGENAGRRLLHDFAALDLRAATLEPRDGALVASVELRSRPRLPVVRYAVAFWVTRVGQLAPLQATGGFLASPG